MAETVSLGVMITKIHGLEGTQDVDERTDQFINSIWEKTDGGKRTSHLTEAQVRWIEDIHRRHYA